MQLWLVPVFTNSEFITGIYNNLSHLFLQDDLRYTIKDSALGRRASRFFYLNPETAVVTVRRPLNRTDPEFPPNSIFQFVVEAKDQVWCDHNSCFAAVVVIAVVVAVG